MKAVNAVFVVAAAAFAKHLWMREVAIKTVGLYQNELTNEITVEPLLNGHPYKAASNFDEGFSIVLSLLRGKPLLSGQYPLPSGWTFNRVEL